MEKYLGPGTIRGIGSVYAHKLVQAFEERVFYVIEEEPERLREVDGIGRARASHIFRTCGGDAVQVMTENLYRLALDIRDIGFKTAEALALKLGIEKSALIQVRASIAYALSEATDDGHCGLPERELVPITAKLLKAPDGSPGGSTLQGGSGAGRRLGAVIMVDLLETIESALWSTTHGPQSVQSHEADLQQVCCYAYSSDTTAEIGCAGICREAWSWNGSDRGTPTASRGG